MVRLGLVRKRVFEFCLHRRKKRALRILVKCLYTLPTFLNLKLTIKSASRRSITLCRCLNTFAEVLRVFFLLLHVQFHLEHREVSTAENRCSRVER